MANLLCFARMYRHLIKKYQLFRKMVCIFATVNGNFHKNE